MYHKINIRGIAIAGGVGRWLFFGIHIYLADMAKYVMLIPLLFIIVGYFLIKREYEDYKLRYLLLGMIFGWGISYLMVLGKRLFQNSLTSYFNFNPAEEKYVVIMIAILGITGWLFGKYSKHSLSVLNPQDFAHHHAHVLANLLGVGDKEFVAEVPHQFKPDQVLFVEIKHDSSKVLNWLNERKPSKIIIHFDLDVLDMKEYRSLLVAYPGTYED